MASLDDDDLVAVTERLRSALGDARGKIRLSDARTLAGFDKPSFQRKRIVASAMGALGWERVRVRFDGVLNSAFTRGSLLEREVILDVKRGPQGRPIVKKTEP
jgi:hypothetical protein